MKHKAVNPGDCFHKVDSHNIGDWVVIRIIRCPGVPTHYVMQDLDHAGEVRTISEPTLLDPEFYRPIPRPADADQDMPDDMAPSGAGQQPCGDRGAVTRSGDRPAQSPWAAALGLPRAR